MNWESSIIGTPSMAGIHASTGRDAFLSSPIAGWDQMPSSALGNTSTPNAAEFKTSKTITLMDRQLLITEDTCSGPGGSGPGMTPYAMSRAWVRNDVDLDNTLPSTTAAAIEPFFTTASLPPPPRGPRPSPPSVLTGGPVDVPKDSIPEGLFDRNKKHWEAVRAHHAAEDKARLARHAASLKFQF